MGVLGRVREGHMIPLKSDEGHRSPQAACHRLRGAQELNTGVNLMKNGMACFHVPIHGHLHDSSANTIRTGPGWLESEISINIYD